jgi:hypothetical protein
MKPSRHPDLFDRDPQPGEIEMKTLSESSVPAVSVFADITSPEALKMALIEGACVQPEICDLVALVEVLERTTAALATLKTRTPRREHVAAHGHLRSALTYEQRLLQEALEKNGIVRDALNQRPRLDSSASSANSARAIP